MLVLKPVALVAFFDESFNANLHRFDWALASVLLCVATPDGATIVEGTLDCKVLEGSTEWFEEVKGKLNPVRLGLA